MLDLFNIIDSDGGGALDMDEMAHFIDAMADGMCEGERQ